MHLTIFELQNFLNGNFLIELIFIYTNFEFISLTPYTIWYLYLTYQHTVGWTLFILNMK